jgi:hypothetical protein
MAAASQHPGGAVLNLTMQEASQRMNAVSACVRRNLEIMAREYEAFPAKHQEDKSMDTRSNLSTDRWYAFDL